MLAQGPGGPIALRAYRPSGSRAEEMLPALVYFHGGGWTIGDLDTHDVVCRQLANGARCAVFSVDYRMGPENPFPAAVDDCLAATQWVAAEAGARLVRAYENSRNRELARQRLQRRGGDDHLLPADLDLGGMTVAQYLARLAAEATTVKVSRWNRALRSRARWAVQSGQFGLSQSTKAGFCRPASRARLIKSLLLIRRTTASSERDTPKA